MKKLLILVAFLAGVVGIVAVIGAVLPRDHVVSMTVTVAAPPVRVWTTVAEVSAYPSWRSEVKSVEVLATSPLEWRENTSMGPMTLVADEFRPPSRLVARMTDEDQPFGGEWEYDIAADSSDANKTRVTITERGWVSNPIFRFVSKFVMGHDGTIDTYLRALSRRFGPEAVPIALVVKDS